MSKIPIEAGCAEDKREKEPQWPSPLNVDECIHRLEVVIFSNLPPPVHGVSIYNQTLLSEFDSLGVAYSFIRVGARDRINSLGGWSMGKAWADIQALWSLALRPVARTHANPRRTIFYFTPAQGGPAVLRDFAAAGIARRKGYDVIAHLHGCGWLAAQGLNVRFARTMRRVLNRCDVLICLGVTYAKLMQANLEIPCFGVNNGTPDPGMSTPVPPPSPNGPIRLLFLSNLHRSKGVWIAAEAVRILRSSGVMAELTLAGDWPSDSDRAKFQGDFAEELGAGSVHLAGLVGAIGKTALLERSHFLLLPTRYPREGQPLCIIEAMSRGVIPLTTDQGAIRDLLDPTERNLLASPDHEFPHCLAERVRTLSANKAAYSSISKACIQTYTNRLTSKHSTRGILTAMLGCGRVSTNSGVLNSSQISPQSKRDSKGQTCK